MSYAATTTYNTCERITTSTCGVNVALSPVVLRVKVSATGRFVVYTKSAESSAEAQHTFERQPLGENPSALAALVALTVHNTGPDEPARVPPRWWHRTAALIPPPLHLAAFAETRRGPPAARVQEVAGIV